MAMGKEGALLFFVAFFLSALRLTNLRDTSAQKITIKMLTEHKYVLATYLIPTIFNEMVIAIAIERLTKSDIW